MWSIYTDAQGHLPYTTAVLPVQVGTPPVQKLCTSNTPGDNRRGYYRMENSANRINNLQKFVFADQTLLFGSQSLYTVKDLRDLFWRSANALLL